MGEPVARLGDHAPAGACEAGIEAAVHYRHPSHVQPVFREYTRPLPVTEHICEELLTLPLAHDEDQQQYVIDTVKAILRRR